MADSKYGKYIVSKPMVVGPDYSQGKELKGITFPSEIFMNRALVKGCPMIVDIGWHFTIPDPDPVQPTHSHDFDTVLCFVGSDPKNPSHLGAVLEMQLGDEKHRLTKTCAIYIPRGLKHCPLIHIKVDRPYLQIIFATSKKESCLVSEQTSPFQGDSPGLRK